jgi:tetratricopeptide (TPR) repeat protein
MRNLLSLAASKRHRYLESLAEARRAMALFEAADPRNPSLVASLNNAAYALHLLRRIDESAGFYQRALDLSREVLGEENRVTAIILLNYASVLRALHRPEAESVARKGREVYRRTLPRDSQIVDVQELGAGSSR